MPSRRELANALRFLSIDAVQQANSGHPGMPMGMADIAEVLWNDFLRHNPANPAWPDRDRFVLSNGHGSMLLYALLHLSGYPLPLEQLRNFRQLHAQTPGHPEYGYAPGVETTTGPLGQGLANAVGMAMAERMLAEQFNRPHHTVIDHHTWVFLGDGCLMEGISHEACSLAGTLKLGKLIALWDDNGISIDGKVEGWFSDDTVLRFRAYGWQVIDDVDGHDPEAVCGAIHQARAEQERPSIICCRTQIGFGSPKHVGTAKVHGSPLGAEEIDATRRALNWPHAPFEVPETLRSAWDASERGAEFEKTWQARFEAYRAEYPELAAELQRRLIDKTLPETWPASRSAMLDDLAGREKALASRVASQQCLDHLAAALPELCGGSADLSGSNGTLWKDAVPFNGCNDGRYLHFGVREFGMSALLNGIALHGGLIPFGGTFLVFSDYARNAIRMAALMRQRVAFVLTHDSIGLGEDGPTHQPVEHLASLRLIPNLEVWRPADNSETAVAWACAIEYNGPSALALTRQGLPPLERDAATRDAIERGGYVLHDPDAPAQLVLIATGSEVQLALEAAHQLGQEGNAVRVVSMPCCERFDAQDADWREQVLPTGVPRLAIEAGCTQGWYRYVGLEGDVIGLDRFGESAPAAALFEHFGFTTTQVVERARTLLDRS